MPPRSYIAIALIFAALAGGGFLDRLGLSVSRWYQVAYIVTCLLAVPGAFRISSGLRAQFWVGIALASPGLVSAGINLHGLINGLNRPVFGAFHEVAYLTVLAAAAAAIHLAETISGRRTAYRVAYWILAIASVTTCLDWLAGPMGWRLTGYFGYPLLAWAANIAAIFVKYGAFISAAMLIVIRRDVERWTGIVISLISAYLLYRSLRPLFVDDGFAYYVGWTFWLWPGVMLIGAAAVWRMGSLLNTSPVEVRSFGAQHNTVSNEIPTSNEMPVRGRPETRPFVSRGVAIYFGVLCVLTFIAFLRDAITIAMFMLIIPGFILIAAPTLLYYSIAVLPAYFVNRFGGNNVLAVTIAAASLCSAAVLPHYVSWYLLQRLVASDHSNPPDSFKPRSFELPFPEADNYWTNWRRPESRGTTPAAPCADLCQQLLFKGNVDQVVIRDHSELGEIVDTKIGTTHHVVFKPRWRRFRLQRREACPDTLSLIAAEFVHEVGSGRCLVEDVIGSPDADANLSITKAPPVPVPRREGPSIALRNIQTGPMTVTITERRDQRTLTAEVRTALEANYAPLPFYFGVKFSGLSSNIIVATDRFPSSFADPFEMISRRYGFSIASAPKSARLSAVPVSDDDRTAVNAILKQDYGTDGHIPITQTRLVASFVSARLKTGQINQDDIDLIRTLLKQRAFAAPIESKLPQATYQALKPLLPDMFERIAYRADGQTEMVQSLNVMLEQFSVEDTDPYSLALCQDYKNLDLRVCYKRKFRDNAHKN